MMEFLHETPLCEPLIFDTHAHYDDEKFDGEREDFLDNLQNYGVYGVITAGCDLKSTEKSMELSEKFENVFFMAGFHPENIPSDSEINAKTNLASIENFTKHKKCVGIGEIGLDYYWTKDNKELQKKYFSLQLDLSCTLSLPVTVHDRDAHEDTLNLLRHYRPKGVVHSFSGSPEMAEELFRMGLYIGIGGVITFKNARRLPEVVKSMPLDRFVLETDAPYLAPVPYRSKINNSAMIYLTAEKIGEIKGLTTKDVLKYSLDNSKRLFDKINTV